MAAQRISSLPQVPPLQDGARLGFRQLLLAGVAPLGWYGLNVRHMLTSYRVGLEPLGCHLPRESARLSGDLLTL